MSQACSILTLLSSRASQIEVPAGASISAPWGQYSAWGSILITGMTDLLSDQKSGKGLHALAGQGLLDAAVHALGGEGLRDRKSTRLNSSHSQISYAVFCLEK